MKRRLILLFITVLAFVLAACGREVALDYYPSDQFKHITNGGVTEDENLPYKIDAITSATLTVEGPGVVASIPLSTRELENRDDGIARGFYTDSTGTFLYEGIDLHFILNSMTDGDNGILLTDKAYGVILKNNGRETIAEFSLGEVARAHEAGEPILIAYGIGAADGSAAAPFVFDAASEGEHSLGYVGELDNEDGCLRLIYNIAEYGADNNRDTFSNVAYIYICEENEPGFKHTGESGGAYGSPDYTDYILTFRGDALGHEIDLTLENLESLVVYDDDGNVVPEGIGYSDNYSLANNAYWYVNEYEGLDLYKMLIYLGMDSYEEMGSAAARTTFVNFVARDGKIFPDAFSIDTLSYPDAFGFYMKNSTDTGDGSYVPTAADLVKSGFPVLLAYGVNNYPYTISSKDEGYLSGLANSGGPMRVVFGKTQYNHANGSNQVQLLSEIIAGSDVLYNTHKYTNEAAHAALSENTLPVTVYNSNGERLMEKLLTVGEVEGVIYGESVSARDKKEAKAKDSYEVNNGNAYETDIYEGVDLEYFLMNIIGIPGTIGTVTFSNGTQEITVNLDDLFGEGYNAELGRGGLPAILAFAKNGSPLVASEESAGYVDKLNLFPNLDSDPAYYAVNNSGGPLAVLIPSKGTSKTDALSIMNVTGITVNLEPDAYAHLEQPYDALTSDTVKFFGEGLQGEAAYSVSELESRQTEAVTMDYSVLDRDGHLTEVRYRGIPVYDLLTEIGLMGNAGTVKVYDDEGISYDVPLSQMKGTNFKNYVNPEKEPVCAVLAYGVGIVDADTRIGMPLVRHEGSEGFNTAYGNDGGALMLIVPQKSEDAENASVCIKHVSAIEVTANDVDTWEHAMSDIYSEFLDYETIFTIKNDDSEWSCTLTVSQLESLKGLIVRDDYSVLEIGTCEGVDIWKLIQLIAGGVEGIDNPISVTAYAEDGYKNDLLSVVFLDGLQQGVENAKGDRKAAIICYAINGYPCVDDESHEGYTGLAGNAAGPLRIIVEGVQGASVKYFNKLIVTVPGSGEINIALDKSMFNEEKG